MIKDGSTNLVQNYIETANQLGSEYITVPYIVSELRGTTMITKVSFTNK
jgi:hypothetical protein